jgi:hypothetical protein
MFALLALAAAVLALNAPASGSVGTQITITSSIGAPNRGDTGRAVDGNLGTETYTTPSYNTADPSYLEVGFASATVNRIRLYKDTYAGPHNLTIQYTTDTGPLTSRDWSNVTGLSNGYVGTELLNATSVNSGGTVTGDAHDSPNGDGWASLLFDNVAATGLRIAFSGGATYKHYHVYELEAWYMPTSITITKVVVPKSDIGRFDLILDGNVVKAGAQNRDSVTVNVTQGSHTVGELPGTGYTKLSKYVISITCTPAVGNTVSKKSSSVSFSVAKGDPVICTITNQRK